MQRTNIKENVKELIKPKVSGRKVVIRIRTEITETEKRKSIKKTN